MPLTPVNNPPAPVQEEVNPALPEPADCETIKTEFGIETGSYRSHGPKKSDDYQSHHVLQNEAVAPKNLISKLDGLSVLLFDRFRGTEHLTITGEQNARRDNKKLGRAGPQPAATFGDLKKQAKEDLSKGLEGKRSNSTGKPMTKAEADRAADCIVNEAEEAVKEQAKKNGKKVDDNTPVNQPGGCLTAGTMVWLHGGKVQPVEALRVGDRVLTPAGARAIVRVDGCHHDIVEIDLGAETLTIASFHQIFLADGQSQRADALRPGVVLATARGPRAVLAMRPLGRREAVYRISLGEPAICLIGDAGIWSFLPEGGPPVVRHVSREPFVAEMNAWSL